MKKRLFIPVSLALLVSLMAFSIAFAQTEDANTRPRGGRRGIGQITSIGSDQFTIRSRMGEDHQIFVDEQTRFRNFDGRELEFGDLQVDDWVAVTIRIDPAVGPKARLVMVLPDNYDPAQRLGVRARGHITVVDQVNNTFTLHSEAGKELTFLVNDNSVFKGAVDNFDDLQVGMIAGVAGVKQDDGRLLAHVVITRYPLVRIAGEIVSVEINGNSFVLDTRRGDNVSILVDESTKFRSRGGEIQGLDDLQPGMVAVVSAKRIPDRGLVALLVAVGTKDQLPAFDLRVVGKIIAVSQDDFTLQARNGDHYTLLVNEETRFRSRGNRVHGLEDLRVGMLVGVGAENLGDTLLAKVVLVGKLAVP